MEIIVKIKDFTGKEIEVQKTFGQEAVISHDFSKIEGIVENIRTEMLKEVERKILEENQSAYVKKTKKRQG